MAIEQELVAGRVMRVFNHWQDYYLEKARLSPEKASHEALNQTLYSSGLDGAQITLTDLDRQTTREVAGALIEVSGHRLGEIIQEFTKGEYGDPVDQYNFSDPRTMRILSAGRRILDRNG